MAVRPSARGGSEVPGAGRHFVLGAGRRPVRMVALVLMALTACSDATAPAVPAGLTLQGGGGQEGEVGLPLPQPIVFEVLDDSGDPIAGAGVSIQVSAGGGSVTPATGQTGPEGRIQAVWTLGTDTSEPQQLTAHAGSVSAQATATTRPGPPSQIVLVGGNGQVGPAGAGLPDSLVVRVFDSYGNPIPNALVTWLVEDGSGNIAPIQVNAGPDGRARARWTLGASAGTHDAEARAGIAPPVHFQATALPNAGIAGTITLLGGFLAPPSPAALGSFTVGAGTFGGSGAQTSPGGVRAAPLLAQGGAGGSSARAAASGSAQAATDFVPGEWVVRLRAGAVGAPAGGGVRMTAGAAITMDRSLRSLVGALPAVAQARASVAGVSPVLRTVLLRVAPGENEGQIVASLRADPRVESVDPVGIFRSHAERGVPSVVRVGASGPVGPRPIGAAAASSFLDGFFYPRQSWHYGMISVPRAWEVTEGNSTVIVAVVDDGIRFDHLSLTSRLTNDGYDFVQEPNPLPNHCSGGTVSVTGDGNGPDSDPTIPASYSYNPFGNCFSGPDTFGGHGLHVAGTIAAAAAGVVGVAPRVRIRPVRVLGTTGQGSGYDVAQGILYAAGLPASDGAGGFVQAPTAARVINLSLGGPTNDVSVAGAITAAANAGVLIVASSGNAGMSLPQIPHYPAALPEPISVGAVGPDFNRAPYSSYGNTVDLAAPGGNLNSFSTFAGGVWSAHWNFATNESYIAAMNGTSMAAPHVSGVAALLFSQNPGMSAAQAKSRLYATARDLGDPGTDPQFGHGLVDALRALTDGAGLPSTLRASLYDAVTGERVAEAVAQPDRSFQFSQLEDGSYLVYAGGDDRDDGITGRPPFHWGARGGSALPTPLTVAGGGIQDGSLSIGHPLEQEPNNTVGSANRLPVGGYLFGTIASPGETDHFRVSIAIQGSYTFETGGVIGLCGFGLEVNSALALLTPAGAVLAQHDNLNEAAERYCARITMALAPGEYILRVQGTAGSTGSYSVRAF